MFKRDLMEDLTGYLMKNLKKGYTKESLRWALLNQGYSKIEVDKAIKRVDEKMANSAPILKTKPKIEYKVIYPEETEKKKKKWGLFG